MFNKHWDKDSMIKRTSIRISDWKLEYDRWIISSAFDTYRGV